MKKFGILAAVIVGVLAIPSSAFATHNGTDCTYTGSAVPVYAHTAPDGSGSAGNADVAAGACVDGNATTPGGSLEAGLGNDSLGGPGGGEGAYVVFDGDNDNTPNQAKGYIGLSNYEDGGARDADCSGNGPDQGVPGSTNSGGCLGVFGVPPWVDLTGSGVPTPICGNTTGNRWDSTSRDGCAHP